MIIVVAFFAPFFEIYFGMEREKDQWLEAQRLLDLDDVDEMPGVRFEEYVATLMEGKGYEVRLVRGGSDYGVDLIAKRGGIRIAIQTKRYSRPVPRNAVSDVVDGGQYFGCEKVMVVTNNIFAKSAQEFAKNMNCTLIDRIKLSEWIRDFRGSQPS